MNGGAMQIQRARVVGVVFGLMINWQMLWSYRSWINYFSDDFLVCFEKKKKKRRGF